MALNKLKYNSLNLTPAANKAIGFDSDADALEATLSGGAMTFIKKLTASSSSTLSFVDGSSDVVLDNTYKEYMFIFNNIDGSTVGDDDTFNFNLSSDGGSNYDVVKTSTYFNADHYENDSAADLGYNTNGDLAQSSSNQQIARSFTVSASDSCLVGCLHLFNPSSTTFVKHFIGNFQYMSANAGRTHETFIAGYGNTTSSIDAIKFELSSGNIDSGTIPLLLELNLIALLAAGVTFRLLKLTLESAMGYS
jgi:hypothetical protein